jgi:hypothetical protein
MWHCLPRPDDAHDANRDRDGKPAGRGGRCVRRAGAALVGASLLAALVPQSGAAAASSRARAHDEARALAAAGIWSTPIGDLAARATRREFARVLVAVGQAPAPAPVAAAPLPDLAPADPDAPAIGEAIARRWLLAPGGLARADAPVTAGQANRGFVRMLGLDLERRALARLSAGGVRLRLPAGFATEVLAARRASSAITPGARRRLSALPTRRSRARTSSTWHSGRAGSGRPGAPRSRPFGRSRSRP